MIIARNVANIYREPDAGSEVVSQAVLGDTVDAGEERNGFVSVRTSDRYAGWVRAAQLAPIWDNSDFLTTTIATLFADVYESALPEAELITKLPVSSRVTLAHGPSVGELIPIVLPDRTIAYVHTFCLDVTHDKADQSGHLADPSVRRSIDIDALRRQIVRAVGGRAVEFGRRLIGTPYLWGGCTPFGIDCSGFVQLSFKLSGVQLLRDASLQFADRRFSRCDNGNSLDESDLLTGDLVVFQRPQDSAVSHVGIAMGDGRFIHSSSGRGVNIDWCNSKRYGEIYAGAVRLSADADLAVDAA